MCAEDDEPLPDSVLAPCLNGPSSCFADACDQRRPDDRDALNALIDTWLTK